MNKYIKALEKRGFTVHTAVDAAAARELLLSLLADAATVGIGGSMTVKELDVAYALLKEGKEVFWHWLPGVDANAARRAAMFADVYLCSANAVTDDGKLLFIDGSGNRVAALAFGPKRVILVIGKNKLCGDEADALARIRREACGPNARRLGLKTPCGLGSECLDCSSSQRFCNRHVTCPMSFPATFWRLLKPVSRMRSPPGVLNL